jgi:hypothetical protein
MKNENAQIGGFNANRFCQNNQAFRCSPEINLIIGSLALIYYKHTIRFVPHKERIPTTSETPIG